jgi:hypothetical protein
MLTWPTSETAQTLPNSSADVCFAPGNDRTTDITDSPFGAKKRKYHARRSPCQSLSQPMVELPRVSTALVLQLNSCTFSSVQQPSEMETGKGVAGVQPDQRSKGRHRPGVSGLELGERLRILRCRVCVE